MKKSKLFFGFLMLCVCVRMGAQGWNVVMYEAHTYKTFMKISDVREAIDFEQLDYDLLHAAIFYATNEQRKKFKRPVFIYDAKLEAAAQKHSADMVRMRFFSHQSPVKGKRTLSDRLALENINYRMCAENIASEFAIQLISGEPFYAPSQNGGYFSYDYKGEAIPDHSYWSFAQALVDTWMHSPGHRKNILNKGLKHLGCGAVFYRKGDGEDAVPCFMCTQNFCTFFE